MVVPVVTTATVFGSAVVSAAVVVLCCGVVLHEDAPRRDRGDRSRPPDEPDSHRQCGDDEARGDQTHETRRTPLDDVLRIHVPA
jgi:hypothetical protein